MILITGASGHTGQRLAFGLLTKEAKVRVVGRSADRMKTLAQKGADVFIGSLDEPETVKKAFRSVTSAFLMIPPNYAAPDSRAYQKKIVQGYLDALKDSQVKYIVTLSSIGTHLPEKTGPILGVRDLELGLGEFKNVHMTHLRPCYFMENLFHMIPAIQNMGSMASALRADLSIPMIATRDIAAAAETLLFNPEWTGHSTKELLGPRHFKMTEVAAILGPAIGKKDLKYTAVSYEIAEKAMLGMGMSESVIQGMTEMTRSFNDGVLKEVEKRSKENTTATTLQNFAKNFAEAYKA